LGLAGVPPNFRSFRLQIPVDSMPFLSTASYGMALSCAISLSRLSISVASSRGATPLKETAKYPVERTTYVRNRSGISQSRILSFNSLGQEKPRPYLGFCSFRGCNSPSMSRNQDNSLGEFSVMQALGERSKWKRLGTVFFSCILAKHFPSLTFHLGHLGCALSANAWALI